MKAGYPLRLGFIGTGAITGAIVTGLCTATEPPQEIWISPRNAEIASRLATTFPVVHVGVSNQDVMNHADTVLLAVRPQVASDIVKSLNFKSIHRVISLIATFSREALLPMIAPAVSLTLAAPLPSVAFHRGPTAILPPDTSTAALFGKISVPVQVASQTEYEALFACTAEMASFFELLETCAAFLSSKGLNDNSGRQYLAALFNALAHTALSSDDRSFGELVIEHMTKGGLNEQVFKELTSAGVFCAHATSLRNIFDRVHGRGVTQRELGTSMTSGNGTESL